MPLFFNPTHSQLWRLRLQEYTGFLAVFLIVTIYFSTSLTILVSTVIAFSWLLSLQFMNLPALFKSYPVVAGALLLLMCFGFGLSYGEASTEAAFTMLRKYRKLFFISILIPFFASEKQRYWAWMAFTFASVLTLTGSYLMDLGILEPNKLGDPCFKSRITHSIFIGFFAFYCIHKVYDAERFTQWYLSFFVLSIYNLFFVVQGRTGQLIVVALIMLFAIQRLTKKGRLLLVLLMSVLLALFFSFSEKAIRINDGIANTQAYWQSESQQLDSMAQRYDFWKHSLKLVLEKPILGHGTGSFTNAYQRIAKGEALMTGNPHNEFLMITVQLGGVGLLFYLGFLGSFYYNAGKLPDREKWLAQGLWVCLIITSLFNTPLFDHSEGFWFITLIALCFATLQTRLTTSLKPC